MKNEEKSFFQDTHHSSEEKITSANELFQRSPPEPYMQEWMELLREEKADPKEVQEINLLLFRIKQDWLALTTNVFSQVCEEKAVHLIPHKLSPILMGFVNVGGQIRVCIALDKLLEIKGSGTELERTNQIIYNRFIVIEKEGEHWVFPVDEVFGIFRCAKNQIENVPVNLAKSSTNYLKGVIEWEEKSVGYLDDELLFYSLRRSV